MTRRAQIIGCVGAMFVALRIFFSNQPAMGAEALQDAMRAALATIIMDAPGQRKETSRFAFIDRPLSFSYLDADGADKALQGLEALFGKVFASSDCLSLYLELVEKQTEKESGADDAANKVDALQKQYAKEKGLTSAQLASYLAFKAKYIAEKTRLEGLSAAEAKKQAFGLRQIENDWEIFGGRTLFADMEDLIGAIQKKGAKIDVKKLRESMFTSANPPRIRYTLSVPADKWTVFDSWIYTDRTKIRTSAVEISSMSDNQSRSEDWTKNEGGCKNTSCNLEWTISAVTSSSAFSFELLTPAIAFPWLNEFIQVSDNLSQKPEKCALGAVPNRVMLARSVRTSVQPASLPQLFQALRKQTPFLLSGLQFSGLPDLGLAFQSSPRFENGGLTSPFYFLVGVSSAPRGPAKQ